MSSIDHTDQSRLDLSHDEEFSKLVKRRQELSEIEQEGRKAANERKEIDAEIIAKLGNAKSAMAADGELVETQTIKKPAFNVPATTYRLVKVRRLARRVRAKP